MNENELRSRIIYLLKNDDYLKLRKMPITTISKVLNVRKSKLYKDYKDYEDAFLELDKKVVKNNEEKLYDAECLLYNILEDMKNNRDLKIQNFTFAVFSVSQLFFLLKKILEEK